MVFQLTGTDLRSFCVKQDGYGNFQLFAHFLQKIHTHFLFFMVSMGEIKTRNIHAILYKFFHHFF